MFSGSWKGELDSLRLPVCAKDEEEERHAAAISSNRNPLGCT